MRHNSARAAKWPLCCIQLTGNRFFQKLFLTRMELAAVLNLERGIEHDNWHQLT